MGPPYRLNNMEIPPDVLKKIEEIKKELKPFIEKHFGDIDKMEQDPRTKTYLIVHKALTEVMKRDHNYLLVVENK